MSIWKKEVLSCSILFRNGVNFHQCQCPHCYRWCIKMEDAITYKYCPYCGLKVNEKEVNNEH